MMTEGRITWLWSLCNPSTMAINKWAREKAFQALPELLEEVISLQLQVKELKEQVERMRAPTTTSERGEGRRSTFS